jgi:hypothetical protein
VVTARRTFGLRLLKLRALNCKCSVHLTARKRVVSSQSHHGGQSYRKWKTRARLPLTFILDYGEDCLYEWPRGLSRRSAAAWLLGSRVRFTVGAWMFVCCVILCRYRSLRRADRSSRGDVSCVCMCVIKKP